LYVTNYNELRWNVSDDLSSTAQETDKAVIDVEAQDDGIMGKILVCFLPTTEIGCIPTHRMYMTGSGRAEEHSGWEGHRSSS